MRKLKELFKKVWEIICSIEIEIADQKYCHFPSDICPFIDDCEECNYYRYKD